MSAKRTVIEQKFKKMEAEAKRLGVTLLTKPEAFIDDDHLDCTWYGGYIGGLRYKGYVVSVAAMGDVRVSGEYKGVEGWLTALSPALFTKKGEKHEKKERTQAPDRQGNRLRC